MLDTSSVVESQSAFGELLNVEQVDFLLKSSEAYEQFLQDAGGLFRAHGVPEIFGIRLLHRHYECDENEIAIEFCEKLNNVDVLVTKATKLNDVDQRIPVATTWVLSKNGMTPIEFSMPECLHYSADVQTDLLSENFLMDLYRLLEKYNYASLVGLSVVDRPYYESALDDEIPVESTDKKARVNILEFGKRSALQGRVIETSWQFPMLEPNVSASTCKTVCKSYCYGIWKDEHETGHYNIHAAGA